MNYNEALQSSLEMQEEIYQLCQKYNMEIVVLTEQDVYATLVRSGVNARKSERLAKEFWGDEDFRNGIIANFDTYDNVVGLIDWNIVNKD
jgi:hypothetical protein